MPQSKNKVELLGHYGSDESHALSAWTSTSRDLTDEKRGRIDKLLAMLAREGHHSVFEKSSLHFLVTTDIASHIHLLKHRIGVSINAESARYKELKDDNYYIPDDWPITEQVKLCAFLENAQLRYHQAIEDLVASGMPRKRAKESARFYLPYANQITADVMFNWRSFHHFLQLRKKPNAQKEIFDIASQMLQLTKEIPDSPFKYTIDAFGYGDE